MKVWTWVLLGTCSVSVLATACSDDDPVRDGAEAGAGGLAAAAGNPSQSGGAAGTGDPQGQAGGGTAPAVGGSGPGGVEGGGWSGETDHGGGEGGAAGGGEGGAAGGGEGGAADSFAIACPDLGKTVTYRAHDTHPAEVLAAAARVGCDLSGERDLVVERFQVTQPSVFVAYAAHSLDGLFDAMRLDGDCGPSGVVASEWSNPFVHYPSMVAELLPPATYTSVFCSTRGVSLLEPPPAAPTNVDCAHAKPLGITKVSETRIVGKSETRFYRVNVDEPNPDEPSAMKSKLLVSFTTAQTNAQARGTLTGITAMYSAHTDELPYMMSETYLTWSDLLAGDYCLEIQVPPGAKYDISARTEAIF